jgi:hypothetical protein
MAVREFEVTSWQKFERRVDDLSEGLSEPPWFRGQPEDWPLRPRLLRHLRRRGLTDPKTALDIEDLATSEFKRAAHLYLPTARLLQLSEAAKSAPPEVRPFGLVAWWTIMRHHGAPTRLLDWSRSPFVAAYFASESPLVEERQPAGIVWMLDYGTLRHVMDERYAPSDGATRMTDDLMVAPDAPNDILPLFHTMPTERMLVQQGCFSVCRNVLGDHGEIIQQVAAPALTRLIIPDTVKSEFRRRLRQINLTAHSMFGDLDGLGRHTDENVARLVDRYAKS